MVSFGSKNNPERLSRLRSIINNRTLGPNTPLSVGTAMIFDCDDANPKDWEEYLYVNIHTLYRNFIQAMDATQIMELDDEVLFPAFLEEIETFEEMVLKFTSNKTTPVFYLPSYKNIQKLIPQALLRSVKTEKQRILWELEHAVYEILIKKQKELKKEAKANKETFEPIFIEIDSELPRGKGPSLIFTHNPTDLLSYKQFPLLKLLESHTGKIKSRSEWWTKLTGNPERLKNIPFNRFTLQICGDGNHLVASGNRKMKDYLYNLADKNNWTSDTTIDRIKFCINMLKDRADRDALLKWI